MRIRMIKISRFFQFKYWGFIGLTLLIMAVAIFFNLFGIYLTGSLESWVVWRADSYWYFFAWRVALYVAMIAGWVWIRRRVYAREPGSRRRLNRAAIAFAGTIVLMEIVRSQPHWA